MKATILISILALTAPLGLAAQEESGEAQEMENYIYATYFYCDTARQEEADELIMTNTAPIYDAAVEDGTITGWGWLAHHTGGQWRRVQYHTSSSVESLLAAQETIAERVNEAGLANDSFAQICSSHDDYIWKREAGSAQQVERGPAALSVYAVCSINGEQRAKEIVKNNFATVLDKAVEDGKLTSWGWNSRVLGGEYRVLKTMTAQDNSTLMKARAEIIEAIFGDSDNAAATEYSSICTSHADYLWEVRHEKN